MWYYRTHTVSVFASLEKSGLFEKARAEQHFEFEFDKLHHRMGQYVSSHMQFVCDIDFC